MATFDKTKLEAELRHQLQRAEGPYRRALAMIDLCLPDSEPGADAIANCLTRLEPLMRQTEEIERDLAPCRRQWMEQGCRADTALKAVFDQHQHLLAALIGKITSLEQRMQQLKQQAQPAVDTFVRHQQMQRAYQQAAR